MEATKAKVTLGITIAGVAQVACIKVFVARVSDPSFQTSDAYNGEVELEVKQSQDIDTFNKVISQLYLGKICFKIFTNLLRAENRVFSQSLL